MELSITKISNKERIKAFKVGSQTVGVLLQADDDETEAEARERLKEILKDRKKLKPKTDMDLMNAKKDAKEKSKKEKKTIYINVDKEGECHLSDKQDDSTLHIYKSGKEIPLPKPEPVSETVVESKTKKEKVTNEKTQSKMEKTAKKSPKKSAKKAAKKERAAKKSGATSVKGNPFKVDQSVTYDGHKWKVARAYMYNDKPYCIIADAKGTKKQVSANKLK